VRGVPGVEDRPDVLDDPAVVGERGDRLVPAVVDHLEERAGLAEDRADLAPLAIGLSGNYDVGTWHAWGERGDATYFANPTDYVPGLSGDHLTWLRARLSVLLVVGQGAWEVHPTGSLPSTRRFAALLQDKGIAHELDVWGHDSAHDWPWWQRQLAHHLPRFV
jgi:esterase/lipase superfamily enzyme